jgi:pyoverdine/dityrosine biosynthesis protein Dit1
MRNDKDLSNLYEEEQARFSTEEERKAQHILVKTEKLAKTIIAQLKAGESFAEWSFNDCIRLSADGVTNAESKILYLI